MVATTKNSRICPKCGKGTMRGRIRLPKVGGKCAAQCNNCGYWHGKKLYDTVWEAEEAFDKETEV